MKLIKKDYEYLPNADVLVRAYKNQDENNQKESEQICSEILFKPHLKIENIRLTSWLPRGAVFGIVCALEKFANKDWNVQVSNELDNEIGVLTSCRYAFDHSVEWRSLNKIINKTN